MARTIKIIEAPRLNDLVISGGGTTDGLITLVNDYLATLVDPTIVGWSLDVRFLNKRMDPQWMFTVVSDTGGAALANPFTLQVNQATSIAALETALGLLYAAALPAEFFSTSRVIKLDSDNQGQVKQYVAASLRNALAAAVANYSTAQA
jgi:hypothetical protein